MSAHILTCIGDATKLETWSNIPYFLLQAGCGSGVLSHGLALEPQRLKQHRRLWNLQQLCSGKRWGGFQYTDTFARRLLSQANLPSRARILSLHPMLPSWPWPLGWRVSFYIDMTTRQTFDDYGSGARLSPVIRQRALQQEQAAFTAAAAVVCMCQWAADAVIRDYGINPDKVQVVPGGANLDEALLADLPLAPPPPPPSPEQPLRLGFLGKEWERKGGPFLLQLAEALTQRCLPTVVRAIGPDPRRLPTHPALQPLGFISKQTDTARFVAELQSWHFGTLFSTAEAFGISNRECLRLGVPILAHAVGGIASTLPDSGCGQLFPAHPTPTEVANWVAARLTPYESYLEWRAALAPRWHEFTWAAAVEQLAQVLESGDLIRGDQR